MFLKPISFRAPWFVVGPIASCLLAGCGSNMTANAFRVPIPKAASDVERSKVPQGGQIDFSVKTASEKSAEIIDFYRNKFPPSRGWKSCSTRGYDTWSVHYSLKNLQKKFSESDLNHENRYMSLMYSKDELSILLITLYTQDRSDDPATDRISGNGYSQHVRVVLSHVDEVELKNFVDSMKCDSE